MAPSPTLLYCRRGARCAAAPPATSGHVAKAAAPLVLGPAATRGRRGAGGTVAAPQLQLRAAAALPHQRGRERGPGGEPLHVARAASIDTDTDSESAVSTSGSNLAGETTLLFEGSHVPELTPGLLLYMPIGVALAALRSGLWILGIAIDAPWFRTPSVVSAYLKLLGVDVVWRNPEQLPEGRHVMVSNHTTVGDMMFLFTAPRRYVHLITSSLPSQVTGTKNLPVALRPASAAAYDQLALTSADPAASTSGGSDSGSGEDASAPLHLFPEGGMTNGRGMLRFSRGFMRMVHQGGMPVVPVALRASTPLPGVNTHTLTSSFLANLFWFSFLPAVRLEATVLPPMRPVPGEGRGAFVRRVQQAIADELQVPVSEMTIQQKRQVMQAAVGLRRV